MTGLVAAAVAALVPATAAAQQLPEPATYDGDGTGQREDTRYAIQPGVYLLEANVAAAAGGGPPQLAGRGAVIRAAIPVRPGGELFVLGGHVGPSGAGAGSFGGFNAFSGGGASVVRRCEVNFLQASPDPDKCVNSTLKPDLVTAGGGGGAGGGNGGDASGPAACGMDRGAGSGGAVVAAAQRTAEGIVLPGGDGRSTAPSVPAVGGGSTGGKGGTAAVCDDQPAHSQSLGGAAGRRYFGGGGGNMPNRNFIPPQWGGGGGGSGYFGGGGGAAGQEDEACIDLGLQNTCQAKLDGGGGGGGSSFIANEATLLGTDVTQNTLGRVTLTPLVAVAGLRDGQRVRRGRVLRPRVACALDKCTFRKRLPTARTGRRTFVITGMREGKTLRVVLAYRVVRSR